MKEKVMSLLEAVRLAGLEYAEVAEKSVSHVPDDVYQLLNEDGVRLYDEVYDSLDKFKYVEYNGFEYQGYQIFRIAIDNAYADELQGEDLFEGVDFFGQKKSDNVLPALMLVLTEGEGDG